jgi:hypothetical protein
MKRLLLISGDTDFTAVMAEQLRRQLGLECDIAPHEGEAGKLAATAALIIAPATLDFEYDAPVMVLSRPIKLQTALSDIKNQLAKPAENVAIGAHHRFLPRTKQLRDSKGNIAELTDREAALLLALAANGDKVVGKDALLREVWGIEADLNTHTLETHIYRLRSKIRDVFGIEMIEAAEGGYRLDI